MWLLQDASGKNVTGKFQYGQNSHAQKRAEKEYGGRLFWEMGDAEFIGKDRNEKIWYRVVWRETNPMKKNPYYAIRLERTGEFFYRGRGGWAKPVKPILSFASAKAARKRIAQNHGYDESELEIISYTTKKAFMENPKARKKNPKAKQHWIAYAYQHANDKEFSLGYFDGTRAQAIKHFNAKENVKRYFRPGYTVTMKANPILLHDGYESNPKLRQKGNTKVTEHGGKELTVTLYSTDIVKILPNGDIQLNTGGHKTATTKRRMNEAADELELYFNVYAKKGNWYVDTRGRNAADQTYEFFDGMTIPGPGHLKNPMSKTDYKFQLKMFKDYAGRLPDLHADDLMAFWNTHQNGRNAGYLRMRSRALVKDLANMAANLATAKNTKGETRKMYEKIAHQIFLDATRRKQNPRKSKKKARKKNSQSWQVAKIGLNGTVRWLRGFAEAKTHAPGKGGYLGRWSLTRGDGARYAKEKDAKYSARYVAKNLGSASVYVVKTGTALKKLRDTHKGKAGRRRNPVGPTQREIDSAHNLFREFTGDHPERMQNVKLRVPKTGLVIGELDGVLYTTVRDGKTEKYQHDFKKGSRPLLASSHDGESLHILGGEYEFTERGIEDK